jgi:hypothetical protein
MFVGQIAFHRRECPNNANPGCLLERRPPKDRGLPSPHPGWIVAQALRQTTTPKLVWRLLGSWIRTLRPGLVPSKQVVAAARRRQNRNPREIPPGPP